MFTKKFIIVALLATGLFTYVAVADKPNPNVPNPPLQVLEHNVDASGWIAVHEQGTADVEIVNTSSIDVNVTNTPLPVTGTVTVDNLNDPHDVNVTGGEVDAVIPPTSAVENPGLHSDPGEIVDVNFSPLINATTIVIWDGSVTGDNDPEFDLTILIAGGGHFVYDYDHGLNGTAMWSFTHPIPVSGFYFNCKNESSTCTANLSIIGYR